VLTAGASAFRAGAVDESEGGAAEAGAASALTGGRDDSRADGAGAGAEGAGAGVGAAGAGGGGRGGGGSAVCCRVVAVCMARDSAPKMALFRGRG
jgi:hypothetical protein